MSIGKRILEARLSKGLTRDQLASKARLTSTSIYHYETGRRIPKAHSVAKIAKALGVELSYLFGVEKINLDSIPFYDIEKVDYYSTEGVVGSIVKVFEADFATTVPDNAMFPEFREGDTIFLKHSTYDQSSGRIVLVDMKGQKLVRRLNIPNRGEMSLNALNPEFSPVNIELLDWEDGSAKFIGVVVGKATKVD